MANDYPRRTKTVSIGGKDYTFQELTVAEQDECWDAAQNKDGTFNARLNTRLMVTKAAVDPKVGVGDFAAMPVTIYSAMVDAVRELNVPAEGEDPNS